MDTYGESLAALGRRARDLRILRQLRQSDLAARAGVAPGTVVRFERSGHASLENVLRIASVLRVDDGFERLFELPKYRTLDDALAQPKAAQRQRVRQRRKK